MSNSAVPASAVSPTQDLAFDLSVPGVVDLPLTPAGDLAVVSGFPRLLQDVQLWLSIALGDNPFVPGFGNPLYAVAGQAQDPDPTDVLTGMIETAEDTFIAMQQQAAAQGFLSTDEQVASFGVPDIQQGAQPGQWSVTFSVTSRAGATATLDLPIVLS